MKYKQFQRAAREAYDSIPDDYREGVDGLVVSREALPHPTMPDIYTLGECLTEDYASDWGGPDTTRSVVVLYWGSFRNLAEKDPDFDWDDELWETLTHELRHHLESLARQDALEGVDYALDETFKRDEGMDFDPWYFQNGDDMGGGVYRVERNYYVEQAWSAERFEAADAVEFAWHGERYRIPRPAELGDVHFVFIDGVETGPATLEVVLVRKRSWWEDAKRLLGTYRPVVLESEARAEPMSAQG
ncbi:MAG: metallopeptidase family protein [Gemmatimonadota bacterium]